MSNFRTTSSKFKQLLYKDPCITLNKAASIIGVSSRTLHHHCTKELGMSPIKYRFLWRMKLARSDLIKGNTNVTEVATYYGFNNLGYFAGKYRELFGEYPKQTLQQ